MQRLLAVAAVLLVGACQPAPQDTTAGSAEQALRIVSLSPHVTEMLFAIGAGDRVVGAVEYSDYPPAALEVPRVGDAFRIDYEALRLLEPDLVIAWESGNPEEIVSRLRELGYRVITVEPQGLDSIPAELEALGRLTGDEAQAARVAAQLRTRIAALREAGADRQVRTVFWQISADPFYTVTGRHIISEILAICGGRNVFADAPGLAPAVTLEAILAARPQVIVASVSPGNDGWRDFWSQWGETPAVQDGRLYSVDPDLISRPGPRVIDGAEQICAALADAQ